MSGMADWQAKISIDIDDLKKRIKVAEGELDKVTKEDRKIKLDFDTKTLESAIQKLDKMLDSLGKGTGDFKQFENLSKELSAITSEVKDFSKAFGKLDDSGAKTLLSSIQNIDRSLSNLNQHILNVNKNIGNMGNNTSGTVKQVENIGNAAADAVKQVDKLADAQSKLGNKTNISNGMKDAFQGESATVSVEKTTQAIREENNALDETANKVKQAVSELVKSRDIVNQNWYREKGTIVGKDSKGNDITRDTDEFSFVERLNNGQLQTVLATYNEETGKWAEQVINVRTAFEQVEKAIISADNKINSLENDRAKTLAAHPGYDTSADDALIASEKNHRGELQKTLDFYATEKKYVFEIEASNKRIIENQQRLSSISKKKENLRSAISDEQLNKDWDAAIAENNKRDAETAKQLAKEFNNAWDEANKINSVLDETKNTIASLPEINELSTQLIDVKNKVDILNSELVNGKISVSDYEKEIKSLISSYSSSVNNLKAEWDKNVQAIEDYMNAVTKLNKLKAADAGKGTKLNEIALQEENVAELEKAAYKARVALDSVINPHNNNNIVSWTEFLSTMKQFDQASLGSAESVAKLEEALRNAEVQAEKTQQSMLNSYSNRLESYNKKTSGYDATIARFEDGGWTSNAYLENVQAVKNAVKEYEDLLKELKGKDACLVTSEEINKLDNYEKKIKDTIATVTNMSAAEKGYNFVSGQKELDKIHKLLNENSKMSSEAKAKIRAYYTEIESGNPSMSLDKIHGEILKIYNAEVEAGRAGRTLWDTLKNSGFHQIAAQMAGMVGVYDVINLGKEAISTIVSLDDALVDLKKTTAMNKTQLEDFYYDANDVAKQMGVTTEEIITQASAWSRLGYSSQEAATTMAKLSSKFASISPGMSTDEAQEGLVSIMKAFDIDPDDVETEIMDKVNVLGNKFAEENQDVIEGLKRSAAAMSAMGQSFTDTAALFTGGMEILQDSESMGTALRTLSMRVRGYDEETNQLSDDLVNVTGEVADLTKTAQDSQGVSLFTDATQEHYRSMVEYLGDIADRWDQISEKNQTELLQKLFGKNRANAGAAIIQNFDQVRAAIEAMDKSAGSSEAEMSAIESSLSYKINALKETWVGCVQDMVDRGDLGTIVTGLTKVSEAITFLLDKLGILGSIGLGAGIFSGIKNVGIGTLVAHQSNHCYCFDVPTS